MTSTPASASSSKHLSVSPDPPAAFSALQTTRPIPQRGISLGRAWQTILRPGEPTTSPMNRILSGIRGSLSGTGPKAPGRRRSGGGREGAPGSAGELDRPGLAEDGHLHLARIAQLGLDRAGNLAAEGRGGGVVHLLAVHEHAHLAPRLDRVGVLDAR